jgi:hypothetical protein
VGSGSLACSWLELIFLIVTRCKLSNQVSEINLFYANFDVFASIFTIYWPEYTSLKHTAFD